MKTLFIEPGSPWENGYIESFNGKLRDELLEREAFDTLLEANGAFRAVAAAHQHDPATQCLGLPAPGVAAPGRIRRCDSVGEAFPLRFSPPWPRLAD